MNKETAIITDTASSLSKIEAESQNITLVPLSLIWGDQVISELDLQGTEFYNRIQKGIPTTSAPNPDQFYKIFEDKYQKSIHQALSIHISSENSGTCQNAFIAAMDFMQDHPDMEIKVIDSQALSLAQSFKVDLAKELAQQGVSLDEIENRLEDLNQNLILIGSTGSEAINYLNKSGRLHGFKKFLTSVASVLKVDVIPIIGMKADGRMELLDTVKKEETGRDEVVKLLDQEIQKRGEQPQKIGIVYTRDQGVGQILLQKLSNLIDLSRVTLVPPKEAGSVLGAHVGPRASVVAALWK